MAEQQLLEIGLYFDECTDPVTQKHMSLQDVADKLLVYPLHYFKGKHDITLFHPGPESLGFLVLYNHLVADLQIGYLQKLKQQGYIKSWAVFPPGTWQDYFKQKEELAMQNAPDDDITRALAEIRSRLDTLASITAENILIPGGPQDRYHQIIEEAYVALGLIETEVDALRAELEHQHARLDGLKDAALTEIVQDEE